MTTKVSLDEVVLNIKTLSTRITTQRESLGVTRNSVRKKLVELNGIYSQCGISIKKNPLNILGSLVSFNTFIDILSDINKSFNLDLFKSLQNLDLDFEKYKNTIDKKRTDEIAALFSQSYDSKTNLRKDTHTGDAPQNEVQAVALQDVQQRDFEAFRTNFKTSISQLITNLTTINDLQRILLANHEEFIKMLSTKKAINFDLLEAFYCGLTLPKK